MRLKKVAGRLQRRQRSPKLVRHVRYEPALALQHALERCGHLVERRRQHAHLVGGRGMNPRFEQPLRDALRRRRHLVQRP